MLAAAVLTLGAAMACEKTMESGYITKKVYEKAWTETQYTQTCGSYGANGVCSTWIQIPHTIYHPEEWKFELKEGKETGVAYVPAATWDRYQVGQHYPDAR